MRIFLAVEPGQENSTGFGLGTVRSSIEAHGGTIRENGGPNGGAQFMIEIPISITA